MKILVTAGGTSERIDQVRRITNTGTGKLGSIIAKEFYDKTDAKVVYLCTKGAFIPKDTTADIIQIESVEDLEHEMNLLLQEHKFDAVIHTMAVSDYTKHSVLGLEDMSRELVQSVMANKDKVDTQEALYNVIHSAILDMHDTGQSKISSKSENLVLVMKKTPKVIKMVKAIQPETILVGFKLLVDVPTENLIQVAHNLLEKNACDYVLANDMRYVKEDMHKAMLIRPDHSYIDLKSKREIAQAIVKTVYKRVLGEEEE